MIKRTKGKVMVILKVPRSRMVFGAILFKRELKENQEWK